MRVEDRRFYNGKHVLHFWYEHGKLIAEFGMPSLMIQDELAVDDTPRCWDYPDWWYDWMSIDKALANLSEKDKIIIFDYFYHGIHNSELLIDGWKYARQWGEVQRRVYMAIPQDMKHEEYRRWGRRRKTQAL